MTTDSALFSNQEWYDCSHEALKLILRSLYFFSLLNVAVILVFRIIHIYAVCGLAISHAAELKRSPTTNTEAGSAPVDGSPPVSLSTQRNDEQ